MAKYGNWFENAKTVLAKLAGITLTSAGAVDDITATGDVTAGGELSGESLEVTTGPVVFSAQLPTADPSNAGQLWVDATANYVLKESQG